MELSDYFPVLVHLGLAAGIGVVILLASHAFGQKPTHSPIKDSPYECGVLGEGSAHARFAVKFYVTAMLFILFDIEVVFLIPWVLVFREFLAAGLPILLPILFFLGVLIVGLVYELKKGAIEWEK
ncbi:MAG: NADH-quinone oxidoreductase subunit A [Opitutales bacterium]